MPFVRRGSCQGLVQEGRTNRRPGAHVAAPAGPSTRRSPRESRSRIDCRRFALRIARVGCALRIGRCRRREGGSSGGGGLSVSPRSRQGMPARACTLRSVTLELVVASWARTERLGGVWHGWKQGEVAVGFGWFHRRSWYNCRCPGSYAVEWGDGKGRRGFRGGPHLHPQHRNHDRYAASVLRCRLPSGS